MTPGTVLFLANAAQISYDEVPVGSVPILDGQASPRGFMSAGKESGLIAFAGTRSIMDWLTDANIIQDPYPEAGFVHRGFLDKFREVWPEIVETFKYKPTGYPVSVAGHSLGGALGTLTAYALSRSFLFVPELLTLGSPRVGDPVFARNFNEAVPDSLRIQHHDDLIPRAPKLGYAHVDKFLRIDDDGREIKFSGIWELFERILKVSKADLLGSAETDHLITNYIPALRNWYRRVSIKKGADRVRVDQS